MQKSQKSGAAGRPPIPFHGPFHSGRPAAPGFCPFCIFAFFFNKPINPAKMRKISKYAYDLMQAAQALT